MNTDTLTTRDALANALHAAGIWLERRGESADAVAIVRLAPGAAVGVWRPGAPVISMTTTIDDPAAELCEAAAPLVREAIERMGASGVNAPLDSVPGARLELLLQPCIGDVSLRLATPRGAVTLCAVTQLLGELH